MKLDGNSAAGSISDPASAVAAEAAAADEPVYLKKGQMHTSLYRIHAQHQTSPD